MEKPESASNIVGRAEGSSCLDRSPISFLKVFLELFQAAAVRFTFPKYVTSSPLPAEMPTIARKEELGNLFLTAST